jgi:hypothetical protein
MDLYSILAQGKDRSHIDGLNPEFSAALARMIAEAPPEIQKNFQILSGARSNERQAQLYAAAVKKYGSPEAARKWVAPPGKSFHNKGLATDLTYLDPSARKYAHENAGRYNLAFPMGHEPWHIELANARGGKQPVQPVQNVKPGEDRMARSEATGRAPLVDPAMPAIDTAAPPPGAQVDPNGSSPIGSMLGNLMSGMQMPAQQPAGPRVLQDDSGQALAAAQGLAERGKQLKSAFLPDIAGLISLGKRPPSGVI